MKKTIKDAALLGMLCIGAINATAQNEYKITGSIKDSANSSVLSGSTVILKKLSVENAPLKTLASAQDGSFNFDNLSQGFYRIVISASGYKKLVLDSIEINENKAEALLGALKLPQETKTLTSVVVKGKQPVVSYSADKIEMNVGQTSLAAGSNAFELLKTAPEVIVDPSDKITVRAKPALVLVDGKQTNLSGDDLKTYLSNMPGGNIDKIEVIVNPSAKYDASGGVIINIKTLRPSNLGTNGTLTAGAGTGRYGRYNTGITLNNRTANTNVYGSANFENTKQYADNDHDQMIIGSPTEITEAQHLTDTRNNIGVQLGLDHTIDKKSSFGILAKGNLNFKDRDIDNLSNAYSTNVFPDSTSAVTTKSKARFFTPSLNAYLKTIVSKKGAELSLNADYFLYKKSWRDDFATTYAYADMTKTKAPTYMTNNSPSNNTVRSFSADYTSPVKNGTLEAGIKTTYTTCDNNILWQNFNTGKWLTDSSMTNHFIYSENINAAYVSLSKRYKKYSVTAGLRAEQTNTVGNLEGARRDANHYLNLFPNLSVMYMESMNHIFTFNYKRSIVRYGFDYVNPFIVYQSQYSYQQGNPFILPQINTSLSTSWIYKQFLSTTLTYVHASKALSIVYKTSDLPNVVIRSYDNLQTQDAIATSVSFSKSVNKRWQLTMANNVQYVIVKDNSTTVSTATTKTVTTYLTAINSFALTQKINADVTAMYLSPFVSGALHMRSVFTTNMGLSTKIMGDKATLKLNVSDLFNTMRGSFYYDYGTVNSHYNVKQETRYVNLALVYKFGNNKIKDSRQRKTGVDDERTRMGNN